MMRRRKRKRKLPLFGLTLLLVVVMGVTLLLTGWTVLGEETGLETVAVTGSAILPQESEEENAPDENVSTGKYAELLSSPEQMAAQNMIPLAPQKADEISLVFAGDILFDDNYSIMVKMKGRAGGGSLVEAGFDAAILQEMRGADIFMVNNEFTYTTRGTPTEGKAFTRQTGACGAAFRDGGGYRFSCQQSRLRLWRNLPAGYPGYPDGGRDALRGGGKKSDRSGPTGIFCDGKREDCLPFRNPD